MRRRVNTYLCATFLRESGTERMFNKHVLNCVEVKWLGNEQGERIQDKAPVWLNFSRQCLGHCKETGCWRAREKNQMWSWRLRVPRVVTAGVQPSGPSLLLLITSLTCSFYLLSPGKELLSLFLPVAYRIFLILWGRGSWNSLGNSMTSPVLFFREFAGAVEDNWQTISRWEWRAEGKGCHFRERSEICQHALLGGRFLTEFVLKLKCLFRSLK